MLLCLLPGIGVIAFIVFGCLAPTPGPNRFGPSHSTGAQSATVGQTRTSQASGASAVERIEKLASLRASGAINDGEFDRMKADILGKTEQGNG